MTKTLSALPEIQTERLRLAALAIDDAPALQVVTDDPAITGLIDFLHSPFTLSDAQALIAQDGDGRDRFIGVWHRAADDETSRLIGTVGTHLCDPDRIEIGYWIASAMHGRGYGREAVEGVLTLLRQEFPDRRIIAECRRENTASWHLLLRAGFHPTGDAGQRPGRQLLILS
jgi:RimJ/RimL family protein N-acetyltransferase